MGIQVKICGITSADAADAAVQAGADYTGLVFHERSPRYLPLEAATSLANRMRGRTRLVALLCDPGDEQIATVIRAIQPDMLQLHGSESPARTGAIRAQFELPVMKVLPIAEAADFASVPEYEKAADMLLFDAKPPSSAARNGGHGVAFDWQLLRGRKFSKPWMLAGGLNAENVGRAIRISEAPGVDASSGVETAPGLKSSDLIRAFVAAAHNAHLVTEQQS
jgi:phosphoribosylanthranilate isomerase